MSESFRDTIVPKSDQLNYDDVQLKPITVIVTAVKRGDTAKSVWLSIGGHQPYKPGIGMRRVLIRGWGDIGADWVGKQLTLYGDPTVKFGKEEVGGIKISHMSHIESGFEISLTKTRGKRYKHSVEILKTRADECREWLKKKKIDIETAEKAIGKSLDLATGEDFSVIGKL